MMDKQKYELFCARPILEHLGLNDSFYSSDSPDLFVYKDDNKIGVEIVGCYPDEDGNGSFNALENRVFSVCREYSKKLKQKGVRGLLGTITFTDVAFRVDKAVSTHRFRQIVLAEIERKKKQFQYERHLDTLEERKKYFEEMAAGSFDCKYVESVSYDELKESDIVEFCPIRVGYIVTVDPKFVLACLEKKEAKLSQYKTMQKNDGTNEYWLFICCPINTFCDLEDFSMPSFRSSYDRVYITDSSKVLQLK